MKESISSATPSTSDIDGNTVSCKLTALKMLKKNLGVDK
jgi:hypothetical protein